MSAPPLSADHPCHVLGEGLYFVGLPSENWQLQYINRKRTLIRQLFPSYTQLDRIGYFGSTRFLSMTTAEVPERVWLRLGLDFEYGAQRALVTAGLVPFDAMLHPGRLEVTNPRPDFVFPKIDALIDAKNTPEAITYCPEQITDFFAHAGSAGILKMTDSPFRWHDPDLSVITIDFVLELLPAKARHWFDNRIARIAALKLLPELDLFHEGKAHEKARRPHLPAAG